MTAAIYIRKSREDKDKPAHRLQVQREQLPAYARSQGWQIEIYDDGHASAARGKIEDLKERTRLEQDIRAGKINIILTIELSRLSRDDTMQDYVAWLHQCGEHRVKLATMSRILDPSQHSDWMLLLMEGGFSSVEMKIMKSRMAEGRAQAYAKGKFLGGQVPPPYVYDKAKGKPVIDPDSLEKIQQIWEQCESNSARSVAIKNGLAHITVRRAISEERLQYYQAIRKDPYTGENIPCEWQPCMTAEQADRIRTARKNGKRGYHRKPAGGLLSNLGIFTCGYCGRRIRAWNNHRARNNGTIQYYEYYGCKANETAKLCEKSRMVQQEIINERVITNLIGTLSNIDTLRESWQVTQQSVTKEDQSKILEKQIINLQTKKQRLTAAVIEGVIDFSEAKTARQQIETELAEIKRQQNADNAAETNEPEWAALSITKEEFAVLTFQEQREIIKLSIREIRSYANYLVMVYKFPRNPSGDCEARIHLPLAHSKTTKNRSEIYRPKSQV